VRPLYLRPVIGLANLRRRHLSDTTAIGITGSSGKTTTKDLIYKILGEEFPTVRSDDTNNQIYEVARTILRARADTRFVVQEIGAAAIDGLDKSLRLLQPSIGVVTTIGLEHFKAFRSQEQVAAEKSKLIRCLPPTGTAVLNGDDEYQREFADISRAKILTYGVSEHCDLRALSVSSVWPERLSLTVEHEGRSYAVQTQFCGEHMAYSVLAALATSLAVGVEIESAITRISRYSPTMGRMLPCETACGITFIRDDWKAPYWSIFHPIEFMRTAIAERKIIIIGTISDMPGTTSTKYRAVAESALQAADVVYFFGPNSAKALSARNIPKGRALHAFTDFREFAEHLQSFLRRGDLVLLKGSGGDHMARFALMFETNLACWRQTCRLENMCDVCALRS
jgi:UDP-N-acetylmuramyl pentapeptide synthase